MAIDALEPIDHFVDGHTLDEGGDALKVPMASTHDLEVDDRVAIVDDVHLSGADALGMEHIGFLHRGLGHDGAEDVAGFPTQGVAFIGVDVHG